MSSTGYVLLIFYVGLVSYVLFITNSIRRIYVRITTNGP